MKNLGRIRSGKKISIYSILSLNFLLFLLPESAAGIPLAFFSPLSLWIIFKERRVVFKSLRFRQSVLLNLGIFVSIYVLSITYNYDRMYVRNIEYYIWPLLSIIMIIPIVFTVDLSRQRFALSDTDTVVFMLGFFFLALVAFVTSGRFRFGFGPNMLYRIILFNYLLFTYVSRRNLYIVLTLPAALYVIYATGSRGGVISVAIVLLFSLPQLLKKIRKSYWIFVILCVAVLFQRMDWNNYMSDIRVLNFSLENNNRLIFYYDFIDWISSADTSSILLGSGFRTWPYEALYPHNFVLEIFHGYGVFYCFIILVWVVKLFTLRDSKIVVQSIPFFAGAMVSGSLYDNVVFMGYLLMLAFVSKRWLNTLEI